MTRPGELLSIITGVLLILAISAQFLLGGFHKNLTDSVPLGLYQETDYGDYIGFCLTPDVLAEAKSSGLNLDSGPCHGGAAPILKTFRQASPKSPVILSARGLSVGGQLLANTAPKAYSHAGKPLTHYPFGTYTSGLWAVSSYNPDSFDSRYFGPVEPSSVLYHLKPFWIF